MTDIIRFSQYASERRTGPRRRMLKKAKVAFNNRCSTINCVVRDLTPEGALLRFDGDFRPPHEFDLLIPTERRDHACEVVWRNGNDIGVRFYA